MKSKKLMTRILKELADTTFDMMEKLLQMQMSQEKQE